MHCLNKNKKNIKKTFNYHTEKHRFRLYWLVSMLINLMPFSSLWAQHSDKELFEKFESHFALFDSLIFQVHPIKVASILDWPADYTGKSINQHLDSLLHNKVEKQIKAMKAETGLLISGQTYYRLDEGFSIDDDDALSRYLAKVQMELRWNFLSSSLINRKSRVNEIQIKGELERVALERKKMNEQINRQKEFFREEYDSLLAGILQLRIKNLELLNNAQQYLVSDRSISTDELLKILDEQAIAERSLATIPRNYPITEQLVRPQGGVIQLDTARLIRHIYKNDLLLHTNDLQVNLLQEQEKSTNYWRTLNLSPFFRYSYYLRPEIRNSSNIDAGLAFQIPIASSEGKKRKVLKAERLQKTLEKEDIKKLISENVHILFEEIERSNRGLSGEMKRIEKMKEYIKMRKENYERHIGEYNFMSRIKEYNHYLTCWENFYSHQYKRDCCIAELQNYLFGHSIMDFCIIADDTIKGTK